MDPDDFPGTAHFLEHMLFQGTEKYPSENEYFTYISNNGGGSNAFTTLTNTGYYFYVGNDGFYGALDRFSQFFIAPMLKEENIRNEMNAVNSEFSRGN